MKPLEYENHTKPFIEAFEEWKTFGNECSLEDLRIIVPLMRTYFHCPKAAKRRYTPLHHAIRIGDLEFIRLMHLLQIEFGTLDRHNRNLFHIACLTEKNQIEVLKLLLEYSKEKNLDVNHSDGTCAPLHQACTLGQIDVVKLLLTSESIDVNALDINGKHPLHHACKSNRADIVKVLLSSKEIILTPVGYFGMPTGMTLLHFVCLTGSIEIVELLLDATDELEVVLNAKNSRGKTPMEVAKESRHFAIVKLLKQRSLMLKTKCL